jgi:Putative beta-barrel porin-2, OmpL-like. bbp2
MKWLQGTCTGCVLEGQRIQVSGWTDISYTASSVSSSNLPIGFNYLANDFALQQNWLRVERTVTTSGTTQPTFGFRTDWILPGIDYRFTVARGLFSGQLTANDGQPNTYGIDPVQFYAEAYLPNVGQGLDVKVGRMFCQYGAETIDSPSNPLASHSYAFIYDPFTQTGVMATLQLTSAWSVQLGAILGPDVFIDPAASPYGMFSVKWAPPNGRNSVLLSGILGSGRFDQTEQFNNPNVLDLVCIHTLNSRLSYTLDALVGYQTNVPDLGTATWFSAVNYLTWKFTPRLNGTTRLELFDDVDGSRTGFKGLYTAVTTGLNFQPRKDVIFRPELRYDYNGESRPFDNKHDLFTATADVIFRW